MVHCYVYRYGGDLVHALCVGLGKARTQTAHDDSKTDALTDVCPTLNAKMLKTLIDNDAKSPHKIGHRCLYRNS